MFGLKKSNERIMMPMQEQEGCKDCGPFSIAIMTSLAYEDDPSEIRYKQLDLRQHLIATLFCKRRAMPKAVWIPAWPWRPEGKFPRGEG